MSFSGSNVTGGLVPYHLNGGSAASTNATNVKAKQGVVYSITLINVGATIGYFRFYDTASAPTPSSATNAGVSIPVPATSGSSGAGVTVNFTDKGMQMLNGISFAITGGGTDTDNTNAPTGIYVSMLYA